VSAWFDVTGEGPAVALVHAGIADSRMWEPQLRSFAATHTVVRVDLPGFGNSPVESNPVSYRGAVAEALDAAGIERAALVGTSLGGRVALELALESPERATALVLIGAGLDGHHWAQEVEAFGEAEEAALARGDLEAAVALNVDLWVVGPRRSADEIDPRVRELVAEMQRDAFRLGEGHKDLREVRLDPPASQRLGELSVPTLVLRRRRRRRYPCDRRAARGRDFRRAAGDDRRGGSSPEPRASGRVRPDRPRLPRRARRLKAGATLPSTSPRTRGS
jgi:pimeloyl-ACP methyl ester carboxylesterase